MRYREREYYAYVYILSYNSNEWLENIVNTDVPRGNVPYLRRCFLRARYGEKKTNRR